MVVAVVFMVALVSAAAIGAGAAAVGAGLPVGVGSRDGAGLGGRTCSALSVGSTPIKLVVTFRNIMENRKWPIS